MALAVSRNHRYSAGVQEDLPISGDALKRRRLELGLTQRMIAEALGISSASVTQWETGRSAPSMANINRLLEVLQINVDTRTNDQRVTDLEAKMLQVQQTVAQLADQLLQQTQAVADLAAAMPRRRSDR